MNIIRTLLGRANFATKQDIIQSIVDFERYDHTLEPLDTAEALLIFRSDSQQCWLVFTHERMYFILDDSEKNIRQVLWARDRDKLQKSERNFPHIKTEDISENTGRVLFGDMNKGFMFTKALFTNSTIDGEIIRLLNKHFFANNH